ncbi:N-acetyl-gamma-glutamyl-phosphate reductase [Fructilactobacillus frigidiflavus]|uniref:N-acetyl-gamma-glutamyl-phosphate reductase n=1 Tax=Fructilactobacillus frigidiflavus TaxID=3242688 RepID=UPI003756AEA3
MKVAVVGITGYSGMVLYQLLKQHSEVSEINFYQHDLTEPLPISEVVENFSTDEHLLLPYDSQTIMADNQVVFFATSAGVTANLAQPFLEADFPVIDLSGDFRLQDGKQYESWYHKPAVSPELLQQAYYGLADLDENPGKNYVANPGCYATATLLGLAPLVANDLIDLDSIIVDAKSGFSGAGKKLSNLTHFVQAHDNLQIYKANQHQHIPEIMAKLQQWNDKVQHIQFMTTLVPINRGIMSSIYVKVKAGVTFNQIKQQFETTYGNSPFVQVMTDHLPTLKSVVGTNNCQIGLAYNPVTGYLLIDSVIDNMIKGAAGQAIQNFNQLFKFKNNTGLNLSPVLP